MFGVPESELGVLGDVAGKDVIELGCGTAYFGAWLARRGARVTGVDLTPAQLETARRCSEELGVPMELIEANAEDVPLPDASFDLALSEYGASIWCDPYRWIPEAARLLRPGGELVFLRNSTLCVLCAPDDPTGRSAIGCSGRSSGCTAWSGPARTRASTSSSRTASGSGCCARAASRSRGCGSCRLPRVRTTHELLRLRLGRVGAQVAGRGDLEGPQARVSVPPAPPLVLASVSPQRRAILEQLGVPFEVVPPRLRGVAAAIRSSSRRGRRARSTVAIAPVLGVDTEVVVDGEALGKPADAGAAEAMLERLSGRTHEVVSGLCLRTSAWEELHSETTLVTFRALTPRDLAHYVGSGEWEGRAGGYAIQGLGASLVERIEGDYLNVVGLPAALLVRLLSQRFPGTYGYG